MSRNGPKDLSLVPRFWKEIVRRLWRFGPEMEGEKSIQSFRLRELRFLLWRPNGVYLRRWSSHMWGMWWHREGKVADTHLALDNFLELASLGFASET